MYYSLKRFDSEIQLFKKDTLNHWLPRTGRQQRYTPEIRDQVKVQSLRNPLKPLTQLHSQFWSYVPVMDIVLFNSSHSAPLLKQLEKEDMNQCGDTDNCAEVWPEMYWCWCSANKQILGAINNTLPPLIIG